MHLAAELLYDHLRHILCAHWKRIVEMKDFNSTDLSYRIIGRLLEAFTGTEKVRAYTVMACASVAYVFMTKRV